LSILLASKGKRVLVYDIDQSALDAIRAGRIPFMERGGEAMLRSVLAEGRLQLSNKPESLRGIPVVITTIGTPVDEFLNPTLRTIRECVDDILPYLPDGALLVLRSTVFPGVSDWISQHIESQGRRVLVSFCPERVVQGQAIEELQIFPQIVSGTTPEAEQAAAELFGGIARSVVRLKPIEAEFAKLFCNAYRYAQFAVANQFFMMTHMAGVDYYRVLEGLKQDYPRARDIPGAGLTAGPCLLKDTMQLSAFFGNQFGLGHMAMLVNEGLPLFIAQNMLPKGDLRGSTVGLLGMAFKAENDDTRSSLSYKLKKSLAMRVKRVLTTDPYVQNDPDLTPLEQVLAESDILVLCAPHEAYRNLDLSGKFVVDVWNLWKGRWSS
jgi:UDP-N-acetyl-D-mannosaminuronic acid dehydrogenase